ncbi:P-loop NTPase family protein [Allopontixanthobacter sediminis]|uniref:Capsular biosynthesis protein n=1 Tax=Allopontixanthobacter sediminis TaxID=1689985 RepID=A0A845AZX4_9SPHN|nr:capsular biosynthesis protein [Allopontixanthobacter sediminis]MXP43486.1 capsular biosynthesis protein [Allopontixanthobacter sediminis]
MTEHRKIPVPGAAKSPSENSSSLFERASGAFGLDPFKAPPVPRKLDDPPLKHARLRQQPVAPAVEPAQSVASAPAPAPTPEPAPTPIAVLPSEVTLSGESGSVRLAGTRHPIDRDHLRDQGMIVPEGAVTALIEEFRIVKRQILSAARERGTAKSRRVLICSPHPGEGKTFCATNLAIAMAAERDSEVLLVDADFAKPSILSTLGLPKGPGLMDCLADPELKPENLVLGTDIPGLWVLPAGNQTAYDSEYLSSARTAEVMDRLTIGAPNRIVIFDSPPALSASPAAELAKHVGQAVLVARADSSGQSALEDAVHLLSACSDIKLLLNATNFSPSGRKFGSYYGYGG